MLWPGRANPTITVQGLPRHAASRQGKSAHPECRGRPSGALTQHGRCDRPGSRIIRWGRGWWRGGEKMSDKRLPLDAAAREQQETGFHVPVTRPAFPRGLPQLRQTVAAQRSQPAESARRTVFVPPLLVLVSSANVLERPSGWRDALAMAVRVSTRGFSWNCRFPLGGGHDALRHGDAVLRPLLDLLLIGETGAIEPSTARPTGKHIRSARKGSVPPNRRLRQDTAATSRRRPEAAAR